ncbi:hypothetical protein [Microbulbifer sp. GL-2]|uniref:hypothetical protein n=1 Tax=Microbulbifer sp. GL-2 TaxID=2591606 RepID=UPI0011636897|nr:hypothetical protein [Microbulbifer sp. GL-2]BBM00439.1 hypothetical protein GL2_05130 [Microbulbifer sp. GL-2]
MRNNSEIFDLYNRGAQRELRLVIEIGYDLPLYITSHNDIPGLPLNVILGTLKKCSATSQKLIPEQGLAQIGAISFEVVDIGGQLSYVLRDELEQGNGIKGRTVRLYQGFAGLDWDEFRLEQTQIAEESISYAEGVYRVRCRDIQREMRRDIFVPNTTRLAANFAKADTTLQVFDTSSFEANPHTIAYGDAPGQFVYYLKIKYQDGFEIVRASGKTGSSFTNCARGLFGTFARDHELPEDSDDESGVEVEEFIYLEGPGPQLAYALLTGKIIGTNNVLPSNWHLGIDPAFVVLDEFQNIGADWYKPSDNSKGKILRFDGLEKTDGKKFIETEINLLLGAFMPVNAAGQLGFRRMAGVLAESGTVATIGPDDVKSLGELKYNLAGVRNIFSVQWSWFEQPGFDGKFLRSNNLIDADSVAVHGEAKQHSLKFRGLHNSRHTYTTIKNTFDALRDRFAGPPLSLRLGLLPSNNDLEVGDIVRVSLPQLRDHSIRGDRPYDFNFTSDNEGWIARDGIATSSVSGGVLAVTVKGENPWISREFSPTFSGADIPFVKIRVRRTSDEPIAKGWGCKVFFRHTQSTVYFSDGADQILDLIDRLNANKGEWHEATVDLSQNTDWNGNQIELVRVDIGNDYIADYSYEVDYIRLLPALGLDEYSLDRAMEVQRISIDQVSGAVSVDLFGSYQPAGMIADQPEGSSTNGELPDAWYNAEGTAMTASGLSIDASGFLTADGTLYGADNSRTVFYYLGDLTIPAGRVLFVADNVELRVCGVLQIDGSLRGVPSNGGVGFLGSCRGGGGRVAGAEYTNRYIYNRVRGKVVTGRNAVMPPLNIENNAGDLQGIPDDLRGTGGASGGKSMKYLRGDRSYEPVGIGGAGGQGGAGLVVIARGIAIGVSGTINTTGGDGAPGRAIDGSPLSVAGGSGGGGAPGGMVLLVDGTQNPMPVLSNNKIVACYGESPSTPGRAGQGGNCLGTNAARVLFVPKSRTPYTDYEDPALAPEVQQAIDKAEAAQADAEAALADLDNIAADGVLHQNEKLIVIREYAQLLAEQTGIEAQADGAGLVIEKGNYTGNLAALTSYLGGLSPTWNDTAASTSISRTIWNINWEAAYSARQGLLNAIAQQAREAGMVGATLQFQWDGRPSGLLWPTNTNYAGGTKYSFNAIAGKGFIHVLAYDAEGGPRVGLNGVQVGVMSGPNDASQWYSFPVTLQAGANEISIWANAADGGTYGGIVVTLGGSGDPEALLGVSAADAKAEAAANAAEEAQTDATAALLDLNNIAADGKLHPAEKLTAVREYNQILAEQVDIEGQANSYGITIEKTNYSGAITALSIYLTGAAVNDTSTYTSIDRSTWKAKWQAVYSTRQKVLIKIDQIAGSRADWEGVFGLNKPEDGATNGATPQERAQIRSMRNTFLEDFSDSNYSDYWEQSAGSGTLGYYPGGSSSIGGGAARFYDYVRISHREKIPFDPSKLYRIEARVYVYSNGDADRTMYAGLAGYDAAGNLCNASGADSVGSQHYVLGSGLNLVGQSWETLVAYVKSNASGNAEYSGTRGANHIGAPAKLQANVRFISPLFYCNYLNKIGSTLIDYVKIDVVEVQDQRNLPMIQSSIASLPTSTALSASDAGSTARIDIASHSVQFGFGTISYNAGSITGLLFNTRYYVYCDDPEQKGGAVTYYATTNFSTLAAGNWRRTVGRLTTPSNGGSSTRPPGDWCVAAGSWLREGLIADNCQSGDLIDCWDTGDEDTHLSPIVGAVDAEPEIPCILLTTESGAQVICSRETPVTDREGRVYEAQNCQGVELGVLHKEKPLTWESVERVECAGLRTVYKISVGGKSYAAGINPLHRVITHNGVHKP